MTDQPACFGKYGWLSGWTHREREAVLGWHRRLNIPVRLRPSTEGKTCSGCHWTDECYSKASDRLLNRQRGLEYEVPAEPDVWQHFYDQGEAEREEADRGSA